MDHPESMDVAEVGVSRPKEVSDYLDSVQKNPQVIMSVIQETDLYGKCFNDGLHGIFAVHPLLVHIIDTPQFQRLRSIRMLGMAYLVYPSATHSRFEHCIGVSYLAGELVVALSQRQPELDVSRSDQLCVQIAGLVHDIGHGPFSHTFERFMTMADPDAHWKHEKTSEEMFDYLLDANQLRQAFQKFGLNKQDIEFVKELVVGRPKDGREHATRPKSKRWLYDVVANERTGVDVDKFDVSNLELNKRQKVYGTSKLCFSIAMTSPNWHRYLARDAKATGMDTIFDCKRCIQFSRVIRTPKGVPQICFQDKEVENVYDMFNIRFNMHKQVYQHRVTRVFERMLLEGLIEANAQLRYRGRDNKIFVLSEAHKDMAAFQRLKDKIFDDVLEQDDRPELAKAQEILGRIISRKPYRFLRQTEPQQESFGKTEDEVLIEMIASLPRVLTTSLTVDKLRDNLVVVLRSINYGMDTKNPMDAVGFYSKDNRNEIKYIGRREVSTTLPIEYQECIQSFYYRSLDSEVDIAEAASVIDAWARMKSIKLGTATVRWTTTKRRRSSSEPRVSPTAVNGSTESKARRRLF